MNKKKFWEWVKFVFLLFTFAVGGAFLYQWWDRKQQLEKLETKLNHLEKEEKKLTEQRELQKKQLNIVSSLAKRPDIQKFFTNLLQTYAQKFADSKNIDIYSYPLSFGGFCEMKKSGTNSLSSEIKNIKAGNAAFNPKNNQTVISLNQFFLFSKLGHTHYFATPELSLEISFAKLIECCSHELAHYLQFAKHRESSCESDLEINARGYNLTLAQEHKEFTREIYEMIKNSEEYPVWESEWEKH